VKAPHRWYPRPGLGARTATSEGPITQKFPRISCILPLSGHFPCYYFRMKYEKNPKTGRVWVDMTGEKIGRWTVLGLNGRLMVKGLPQGQTVWRCRCECGREKERVLYAALMNKRSLSCGCLRGEVLGGRAKTHGGSGSKAYVAWQQAKDRCFNPERHSYPNYGGRGITMCDGFQENFKAWAAALGPAPSKQHSVDRENNDGNYSCGLCSQCVENRWKLNVHWATQSEQMSNTRRSRIYLWNGTQQTLTAIARAENVAFCSLRNLVTYGMDVAGAVAYCRERGLTFNERSKSVMAANPVAPVKLPNRTFKKRPWSTADMGRKPGFRHLTIYTEKKLKEIQMEVHRPVKPPTLIGAQCPICGDLFQIQRRRSENPVCQKSQCVKRKQRMVLKGTWEDYLVFRGIKSTAGDLAAWKTRALELATCEDLGSEGYRAVIPGVRGCSGVGAKPGIAHEPTD
jgi:hypothetical protein